MPLIVLRHGAVDGSEHPDEAQLSEAGAQGVAETVKGLPSVPLTSILTSPLSRAQQTAAIWSKAAGVPVTTHPELEAWNLGAYRGKHSQAADAVVKQLVAHPETPAPGGGESALQYWQRFLPFVLPLVQSPEWHGIVTHSRGIRTLESYLAGGGKGLDAGPWGREPLVKPGQAVIVTPDRARAVKDETL